MNDPSMTSVATTMRQVAMTGPGGADVLQVVDAPVPVPAAGEVLIEVAAAGINRPDIFQRMGAYPPPPGVSAVLGLEVAGTIAAIGAGVTSHRIGDAVCALVPGGGYAEFCVAPAAHVLPVPLTLSMIQAAALPETLFTVWGNVFMRGQLAAGETFLVHGGTSGIGTTAIQLAKGLGATVFATARGTAKVDACRRLGADVAIDYSTEDFVSVVKAHTDQRGVDVILDMVGGDYITRDIDALAIDGRLVFIAFLRGSTAKVDFAPVQRKRLTVTGSTLRPQSIEAKARIAEALTEKVWPMIADGRMTPVVDQVFPLAAVAEAHRRMEGGDHVGKIVLTMD